MDKGAVRLAFASLLLCLTAPMARAAPSAADKQARELFQRAEMSFNLGKFTEALGEYQAAYQAKPLPAFLFNVAQCYRNMQSYEQARFFYRRYLALDPRTTNRRLVEDLITEMTHMVEKSGAPEPAPPNAAPAITPPPAAIEPPPVPPPALQAIPATSLDQTPPAVAAVAPSPEAPATAPSDTSSRPIYRRWWFWGGVGAVLIGAGVAALLMTRDTPPQGSLETINGR